MTVSLDRRLTLRALMEQAWQQVEGQARSNAEGGRKVAASRAGTPRWADATRRGEKGTAGVTPCASAGPRCGAAIGRCAFPRLRWWKRSAALERYEPAWFGRGCCSL